MTQSEERAFFAGEINLISLEFSRPNSRGVDRILAGRGGPNPHIPSCPPLTSLPTIPGPPLCSLTTEVYLG